MTTPGDRAQALYRRGDLAGAAAGCQRVLSQSPLDHAALHLLGCIRRRQGRREEALQHLRRAVSLAPSVPAYREVLADALFHEGKHEGAEIECRLALKLDPHLHLPHNLLGLIALARCDYAAAVESFSQALAARTPYPEAMINIAVAFNRTGNYPLAREYCELVLRLAPQNPHAWINLGLAWKCMGRLDRAKDALARAGDHAIARFNLGYVHLLEDDLVRGLPLYEARKKLLKLDQDLSRPEWTGAPNPGGTLLVIHEQGLGDTILMCRFYPLLAERFARVVVKAQKPLARLIAATSPGVEVVTDLAVVRYDVWCGHMSLPHRLGIDDVTKIPCEPWLRLPGARVPRAPHARPRVGLNWAGNPRFAYDAVRSTHLDDLATFLKVGDVEWCSLHKGHLEHEAEAFGLPQPLREARDFLDTAIAIQDLDLVISTETALPNLSAALGVRTCVLAGPDCDWRWKSWYSGVTVCRQEAPGNWFGAIAQALEVIRAELLMPRKAA